MKYKLAIASVFRNASFYLKEWIPFHIHVGVQHFYLANHNSTDEYKEVLRPYIEKGIVELIDITQEFPRGHLVGNLCPPFYANVIKKVKEEVEWLALIDSDEFIIPVKDDKLTTVLDRHKDKPAVCVNWQCYGTSFVQKVPADKIMIETLVRRAPQNAQVNLHVKTILQPRYFDASGLHTPIGGPPNACQMTDGSSIHSSAFSHHLVIDELKLNHYIVGDINYFETQKVSFYRNYFVHPPQELLDRAKNGVWNEEEDHGMDRYVAPIKEIIATYSHQN